MKEWGVDMEFEVGFWFWNFGIFDFFKMGILRDIEVKFYKSVINILIDGV